MEMVCQFHKESLGIHHKSTLEFGVGRSGLEKAPFEPLFMDLK